MTLQEQILQLLSDVGLEVEANEEGNSLSFDGDITIVVNRLKDDFIVSVKVLQVHSKSVNTETEVMEYIKQVLFQMHPTTTREEVTAASTTSPTDPYAQEKPYTKELPPSSFSPPKGPPPGFPTIGSSDLDPPHPQFKPYIDPLRDYKQPDGMILDKHHPLFQQPGNFGARYDPPGLDNEHDIGIGLPQGVRGPSFKGNQGPPGFGQGFNGGNQNPFGGF